MADIAAVTQIEITAKDSTQSAFGAIKGGLTGISNSVTGLVGQFGALGGILGVGAFTKVVKDAVDLAAKLDDLADSTGSSVEQLSGLANAARVSGVDLDTFTTLMNRLSVGIAGVGEDGGKASKALQALGVTARDPATAMKELALQLDKYADGAEKAALLTAIFGKTGAQYAGMLKDLAKTTDDVSTVTTQLAQQSEELQKNFERLKTSGQGFAMMLANEVVPALNGAIDDMKRGAAEAGGFWAALWNQGLTNPFKDIATRQQELRDELEKTNAKFYQLATDGAGEGTLGVVEQRIQRIRQELNQLNRQELRNLQMLTGPDTYDARDLKAMQKPLAPFVATDTPVKLKKVADGFKDMAAAMKAAYDNAMNWILAGEEIDKINAAIAKSQSEASLAMVTYIGEQENAIRAYDEQTAAIGKTRAELDAMELSRQAEIRDMRLMAGWGEEAVAIYEKWSAAISRRQIVEQQQAQTNEMVQMWKSIESAAEDAFTNILQGGKNAFDRLKDALKQGLMALLYQLTVRKFIIQLAATMTGNGGVANAMGAASSGAGSLGGLLSGGSSLGGMGNLGGFAVGAMNAFLPAVTYGSSAFTAAGAGVGFGAAAGTSMMSALAPLMAAMPYVAAFVAVAMIVKGVLDSKKGGPKTGGYGFAGNIEGWDRATHFTPNQNDTAMTSASMTLLSAYNQTLAALGGTGKAGFDIGYDTDPIGKANNRLGVRAMVGGKQVYNYWSGDNALGRDDAALQAAIELETKRAMLAALQASELPEDIGKLLNSLSAAGATSAEIDRILALASAVKTLKDQAASLGTLGDDLEKVAAATPLDAYRQQAEALDKLKEAYDGSATSTDELIAASQSYYQSLVAVVSQIRQLKQQLTAMFGDTRQSIFLSGRDDGFLYDFYQKEVDKLYSQLGSTTDPAKIAAISAQINDYITRAFGLLTPEQQSAARDAYIESIDKITTAVTERLDSIERNVTSAGKTDLQEAAALIVEAATKQLGAATAAEAAANAATQAASTQLAAANTQLVAANTPITIQVDLAQPGGVNG